MREEFQEFRFSAKVLQRIERANLIIAELRAEGYIVTLRQLYYQFVSRGWLENRQQNYEALGDTIDNARKAGMVDWDAIEDRTRFLRSIPDYTSAQNFIASTVTGYAEDLWRDQDVYCEVWIEKDALLGVIERPCNDWRVPYFACRGYPSSSELYKAGKRLARKSRMEQKEVIVLYLGDHDPDGYYMPISNAEWLSTYGYTNDIEFRRIALNHDQIEQYEPPPNPTKEHSARTPMYVDRFGEDMASWELDALKPSVIDALLRSQIEPLVDMERWRVNEARERENEALLRAIGENMPDVRSELKKRLGDRVPFAHMERKD